MSTTRINSVTLVGRSSNFLGRPTGNSIAFEFDITVKHGDRVDTLRVEGYGPKLFAVAQQMAEGALIGIIGSITKERCHGLPIIRLDRLELLGPAR